MQRVCLILAILIQGAVGEVDGCTADTSGTQGCRGGDSMRDSTSLLQRQLVMDSASEKNVPVDYAGAVLLKSRSDNGCLDHHKGSDNVYMHSCHGDKNQQWYFKNQQLHAQYEDDMCLHYFEDDTVKMHKCHAEDNQQWKQQWKLEGESLKLARGGKCLSRDDGEEGDVRGRGCSDEQTQKWYFNFAPVDCALSNWGDWSACSDTCGSGLRSRSREVITQSEHGGSCDENEETEKCDDGPCPVDCAMSDWGAWSACSATCGHSVHTRSRTVVAEAMFGGEPCGTMEETEPCSVPQCPGQLKSRADNKCLDYDVRDDNVYMHSCHDGKNQQWFLDLNGDLSSMEDKTCLDYNFNKGDNVYMHGCHGGSHQKWRFDGENIKTERDDKCLDNAHLSGTNVYMRECHTAKNQKWYWR